MPKFQYSLQMIVLVQASFLNFTNCIMLNKKLRFRKSGLKIQSSLYCFHYFFGGLKFLQKDKLKVFETRNKVIWDSKKETQIANA